jgi:hypothetical protein
MNGTSLGLETVSAPAQAPAQRQYYRVLFRNLVYALV